MESLTQMSPRSVSSTAPARHPGSSSSGPSLLQRVASSSGSTSKDFSSLTHTRTFLEALVPPNRRLAPSRTPSSLGTPYKPQKPSSLSSSASATGSEIGNGEEDVSTQDEPSPPTAASSDASDDGVLNSLVTSKGAHSPLLASDSGLDPAFAMTPMGSEASIVDSINGILEVLENRRIDEEQKIDQVRNKLATWLEDLEGIRPSHFRLDSIVLDVMHRHREDSNPTGATFPSSPIRRPGPARTFSSSGIHRPWTPTKLSVQSATLGSDATVQPPLSPLTASVFGTSAHLGGIAVERSSSPGPYKDLGVIGSGSPRASPRLKNSTLAPISISGSTSGSASSMLEPTTPTSNPWTNSGVPTGALTPSVLSQSFVLGAPSSPFSSVPPGLAAAATSSSRPTSPSPLNSPRMNVAAAAFKPRAGSSSSQLSALTALKPAVTDSPSSRRSSSQAILSKSHPAGLDDDEDDEFSPFGSLKAEQPGSTGSYYSSSATSSSGGGGFDGTGGYDDDDSTGMTPFDVLYSVLSGAGNGSQWSHEQIEEALARHNWDVDATLTSIFEMGGQPPSSRMGVPGTPPFPRSPRMPPAGPAAFQRAPSGGVAVLSRETLASYRGGRTTSFTRAGTPPIRGAGQGSMSPMMSGGGGGGGVGPGRVCRYFLAGDCRRADCRFSHDLSKALCKFWLRGQCLNDPCPFLHDAEALQALASGMSAGLYPNEAGYDGSSDYGDSATAGTATPPAEEFPELPPTGPKAQRIPRQAAPPGAPTGPAAADPSRARWAAALQRPKPPGAGDLNIVTTSARNAPTGPRGGAPPLGPRSVPPNTNSSSSSKAPHVPLRPPTLLPTLAVGRAAAANYASHRSGLVALIESRNRSLAKASEAFRSGDGAGARTWSTEGQNLNLQIKEQSASAAKGMLKDRHRELAERLNQAAGSDGGGWGSSANASDEAGARGRRGKAVGGGLGVCLGVARKEAVSGKDLSVDERTEVLLDCHGLHASEAVEIVEEFLLNLERESHVGLTYLAVGSSKHSNLSTDRRRVKLAGAVKQFLQGWGYPFTEFDGVLCVDGTTHYS